MSFTGARHEQSHDNKEEWQHEAKKSGKEGREAGERKRKGGREIAREVGEDR